MSTTTTNFSFIKPSLTDAADITKMNTNWDKVDAELEKRQIIKTITTTIGTNWVKNDTTGVKSQSVSISEVISSNTVIVSPNYAGSGTSDDYADFVEAANQYSKYIANGYAETYDGGITFYIFGGTPTVNIPIVVEVL